MGKHKRRGVDLKTLSAAWISSVMGVVVAAMAVVLRRVWQRLKATCCLGRRVKGRGSLGTSGGRLVVMEKKAIMEKEEIATRATSARIRVVVMVEVG
jgi:hypothetical protein